MKKKLNMVALSGNELKNTRGKANVTCRPGSVSISEPVGGYCSCGCYYSGCGGSSTSDNDCANTANGLSSIPY
jgi:hypothetical protein